MSESADSGVILFELSADSGDSDSDHPQTQKQLGHMSSETSSGTFEEPLPIHIVVFATALETSVFGLQKKLGPPRMCRICRTFRKSYPFGAHAATNAPKSTLNILAFLDFW